jgi:uncharacterized protein (TIGR01777 family)
MDVAITGSSGLVGTALVAALRADGHRVVRVVRGGPPDTDTVRWDPETATIDAAGLEGMDAVVHLAGAGIADKRWTDARKRLVLQSRVVGTTLLAGTLATLERKPRVLVSASAVGWYGSDRGDEELTEASGPPAHPDFPAEVCRQWEAATAPAEGAGIRTVHLRTGVIQARDGGMLGRLRLPFRLGLGGRVGSGAQYTSWISLPDHLRVIRHVIDDAVLAGPVDATAPQPVTNREYTETLGRVLRRPTLLPTPVLPLRAIYGSELVESVLLGGQRVLPARLEASGYAFAHPTLEVALRAVLAPAR